MVHGKMLGLVCLLIFVALVLGQHDGYSKLRESRIFHQQHTEIPKQTNFQYSSIGSYSGSSEDSQIFSGEVSKNFIAQNGLIDKVSGTKTFEDRNRFEKFQANNDMRANNDLRSGTKTFEDRNRFEKFQSNNDLRAQHRINNIPGQNNFDERQRNVKFHTVNGIDIQQRNKNRPGLRNFEERQKEVNFPAINDLRVQQQTNHHPGPSNFEERQNYNQFQKSKNLEEGQKTNFASEVRNSEGKQRSDMLQKTRNWEKFQRKDRIHGTSEFEGRQKNGRYEEELRDERRPGRHLSRPGDLRHRRPRMSNLRKKDKYMRDTKSNTEIKRNPKIVKYIADKNGFAVREDLVKPLQETIDRTRQESRRRVVMAVAGPQQGPRMSQVVTSAIRVAGQSGKFLPHIFDLKRPKPVDVDRLAYSLGAREVVI